MIQGDESTTRIVWRAVFAALALVLGSGCAIKYYDKESGTEHLWGFGHLRMKAEPSKDAVVRSVVTGVETLGFSLLVGEENRGVGLGYDNRKKMRIMDDASVAL